MVALSSSNTGVSLTTGGTYTLASKAHIFATGGTDGVLLNDPGEDFTLVFDGNVSVDGFGIVAIVGNTVDLTISESGSVRGSEGVFLQGGNVTNNGSIIGTEGSAVTMRTGGSTLINTGQLISGSAGPAVNFADAELNYTF